MDASEESTYAVHQERYFGKLDVSKNLTEKHVYAMPKGNTITTIL